MVKDYECEILYHPGTSNVVADALSYKMVGSSTREMCMRISIDYPLLGLVLGPSSVKGEMVFYPSSNS